MDNGKMVKVRASRNAHVAVTQYQVLSSTFSSALMELQPITGEGAPNPQQDSYLILTRAPCWTLPLFWATVSMGGLRVQVICVTVCFWF
jgi:hypothetical protein